MPSLRTRRLTLRGGLGLLLLVPALLSTAAPRARAATPALPDLSGRVSDVLGQRIADAEVLIVSPSPAWKPVAAVMSDDAGMFRIPGIVPGVYRVAALKGGYLTFLGQVNTRVDRWIEVVLRPAAAAAAESDVKLPQDATWSLRLPRRSLLRETDPDADGSGESSSEDGRARPPVADAGLHVEVEQLFALQRGPRPEEGGAPGGQGTQTRLEAATSVGQRGRVFFQGVRESFDASSAQGESDSSTRQGAAAVALDVSYDAGPDAQVAVKAFYSQRDLRLTSAVSESGRDTVHQGQRSWGYDAEWSTQLDAASSLALKLDYLESELEVPGDLLDAATAIRPDVEESVSNRSVGAAGTYELLPATEHRLQVDFRARLVESPFPALQVTTAGLADPLRAATGWSIGLDARDTWSVSGPFSVVYGLGYRHSLATRDVSLIVPRLGGSWSIDGLVMQFLVSYHQVQTWGGADPAGPELAFRPARRIGYQAQLELPLGPRLRLAGATRSLPIQFDPTGHAQGLAEEGLQPFYLTDGNAALDEDRLTLVREGAGVRAQFEMVNGRVDGVVAPMLPFEMPFHWLAESRLRYRNGRLGVRVAASGTDLLLDYRTVEERPGSLESADGEFMQESLELRLAQDLLRLRSLGSWRFLLALRLASLEGEGADDWLYASDARLLSIPDREMSAGLSVLF